MIAKTLIPSTSEVTKIREVKTFALGMLTLSNIVSHSLDVHELSGLQSPWPLLKWRSACWRVLLASWVWTHDQGTQSTTERIQRRLDLAPRDRFRTSTA